MAKWTDGIELKIANILCYVMFLGSNGWPIVTPGQFDPYRGKDTYMTPAPWVYAIWPLIHLLLLGTNIYQFSPTGKRVVIDEIGWRFPLLSVLSVVYANVRNTRHYTVAFVFALLVSSTVTHIYYVLTTRRATYRVGDEVLVHLPFSLWHGWATFLLILSAFEAFGIHTYDPAGDWTKALVFIGLFFLEAHAATYASYTREGDLPGAIAITWSLWAVYDHQIKWQSEFIHISALVFAILSVFWVLVGTFKAARRLHRRSGSVLPGGGAERAPLLGR
ncbi:hypothetical protein CONPUDRAFT_98562 [Coniophora puteana RWD-64-598 SS2]|uniref:Uncharacterized protein n=1 Tax=Coniophora puteana (strain RWD-64-598) TaxID=741705 RepID=A0A5M3N256_CONPW|nr:uncharacterized protein CONPUDRAFT_98562 [Coniophora puteana RWD-64-598 SS2]EIW85470.1 hypothetical protein CONPUDRAFT_98562 [Coniophora puteana RWD-64-598 SS2]